MSIPWGAMTNAILNVWANVGLYECLSTQPG
jgi:hypothetical protein